MARQVTASSANVSGGQRPAAAGGAQFPRGRTVSGLPSRGTREPGQPDSQTPPFQTAAAVPKCAAKCATSNLHGFVARTAGFIVSEVITPPF